MSREEHYIKPSRVTSNKGVYYYNKAVDNCFDDFESRTCENSNRAMTLEEFEAEVRGIFISKGFDSDDADWWVTEIEGHYKNKLVSIKRCNEKKLGFNTSFSQVAPTYSEAFELLLRNIKER